MIQRCSFFKNGISRKGRSKGTVNTFCVFCILFFHALFRVNPSITLYHRYTQRELSPARGLMTHCAVVVHDGNRSGDLGARSRGHWSPARRIAGDTLALHAYATAERSLRLHPFFLSRFNSILNDLYYYINYKVL